MEKILTDEGKQLWDLIGTYQEAMNPPAPPEPPSEYPIPFNFWKDKYEALVLEIMYLKRNSELVVKDCNKIIKSITSMEEYVKCDAKIAKTVHENAIKRYDRILLGKPAFDHKIDLRGLIILE